MTPTIMAISAAYFALMLGIGLWAARRTRTMSDFFVAGRGVGMVAIALATMSSAMSGFLFIGGPGIQYQAGFGTLLLTMPAAVSFALAWLLLAKRMKLLAMARPLLTVPDAIHARYDSNLARGLAAVAVLLGVLGYLATQTLAMGVVLARIFDLSLVWGVSIGVVIVAIYAVGGGMIAGIYTDVVQGAVMVLAALATFALALEVGGGMGGMVRSIAADSPDWVGPFGLLEPGVAIGWYLVFALGILGQPQVVHKFYMIDEVRKLRWGPLLAAVCAVLASLVWLSVGTAMRALVAEGAEPLAQADEAAPRFMLEYAPALLAGVFFAGVAAASMSTADSFLIIGASALVRDLPLAFGRQPSEAMQFRAGRVVTLLLCVAAGAIALASGQLVAVLGIFGWGMFASSLAPALGLGLNWSRATTAGAVASLLVGIIGTLALELNHLFGWLADPLPAQLYRSAAVFLLSTLTFIAVSLATPRRAPAADVARVMAV